MKRISIKEFMNKIEGILGLEVGDKFEISHKEDFCLFRLTCFDAGKVTFCFGVDRWWLEETDCYNIRCIANYLDELDEVGKFIGSMRIDMDDNCRMDCENYTNCSFYACDDEDC